jgi:hypothetical protein
MTSRTCVLISVMNTQKLRQLLVTFREGRTVSANITQTFHLFDNGMSEALKTRIPTTSSSFDGKNHAEDAPDKERCTRREFQFCFVSPAH